MILQSNSFLHPFFVTAKCNIVSDALAPSRNLHPGIQTHLPTDITYEVLLYTWKYLHAFKLKLVHDDIKDGTICVLQMIRIPQENRKGRRLNKTVSCWWIKSMNKWRNIVYPFYQ